jgi:hypothetical protein
VNRRPDGEGVGRLSERIALELAAAALAGDTKRVSALTSLIDQIEGKPQESIEHSGSIAAVRLVGFASPVRDGELVDGGLRPKAQNVARAEELVGHVENTPTLDTQGKFTQLSLFEGSSVAGPSANGSSEGTQP